MILDDIWGIGLWEMVLGYGKWLEIRSLVLGFAEQTKSFQKIYILGGKLTKMTSLVLGFAEQTKSSRKIDFLGGKWKIARFELNL